MKFSRLDSYRSEGNHSFSGKTTFGCYNAKVTGYFRKSASTEKLSDSERMENIKRRYRSISDPIALGARFDDIYKDDHYYRSVAFESQEAEQEVFYDKGLEEEDDEQC